MTIMPALAAWVVMPFGPELALANINAGLLFLMAITSLEVYGVIIAGWASNSKYAFLGAMRASAQMVSYELAIGFCAGRGADGVGQPEHDRHRARPGQGYFASMASLPVLELAAAAADLRRLLHLRVAETNRHPFDVVEGESEIVAGHMVEYSGMGFARCSSSPNTRT